jgi:hypothetical protein
LVAVAAAIETTTTAPQVHLVVLVAAVVDNSRLEHLAE